MTVILQPSCHRYNLQVQQLDFTEIKRCYLEYINSGMYSALAFVGMDCAEIEAEGWIVRVNDGREFIDCVSGFGAYNFGHRHPRIVAAVREQLERMPMSSRLALNPIQAILARELAELAPGNLKYSFFSNSGTEAVEAALKLARLCTGKPGIISAQQAFHGKTLGSLSSTHRVAFQKPFEPLMSFFTKVPFGDFAALEATIDENTAAVMLEPIQGEGGINIPPSGYLPAVSELTSRRGVLLILDEVQTGMGRTGYNFSCESEEVCPDILVLAKSLGGGVMPIGATIGTPEVWEPFQQNPTVHSSTFGGNQLACAAARAALQVLTEDKLAEQAAKTGKYFIQQLKELAGEFPDIIAEARGVGMLIGLQMSDPDVSQLLMANAVQQQLLLAYTLSQPGVIRVEPPLIMPTSVVDEVVSRLKQALLGTRQIIEAYGLGQAGAPA